ncbi:YCF48-related protein [Flavobacterium silvaticum]|uniref:T9SS type A sorting domain-containing protein n=1 Tax=Flavobacterium silvaticum TaxID=1852020 RepID=A0A972JHT3_9FLAO|nr:YCF48-related protein [Flavobacterium silvaticum]NMH26577.1 T9SS type A sorting domain-containing protein [Flavobacterium silvaticum]
MKYNYFLFILLFWVSLSFGQYNWELLNPKPSYRNNLSMEFVSASHGYIVNGYQILETQDAGITWSVKQPLYGASLIKIKNGLGFIVGTFGLVYKTTDNGQNWQPMNIGTTMNLNSVTIIDDQHIMISGALGVYMSEDGGTTWVFHQISSTWEQINKTVFVSESTGLAFGSGGTVLKTTDSGQTWVVKVSVNYFPADYITAYFVNENLGFASRQFDDLYRTTDGGETWTEITGTDMAINCFSFVDELHGYACGELGAVYKTEDGGITWNNIFFQNGYYYGTDMYAVHFADENTGFIAGLKGMILKTENGGSSWQAYSPTYNDISKTVFTDSETALALVGNSFFRTVDNGDTWNSVGPPQVGANTRDFVFISPQIGYAVGGGETGTSADNKTVYKTINGGNTWTILPQLSPTFHDNLYCLDFVDASTGVVSGGFNQPSTWRTTNGGMNWTQVNTLRFGKIKFVSPTVGYAKNTGFSLDKIYKTTDAGITWVEIFSTDESMVDFDFSDEDHGYFSGDNAIMFKTSDGGGNWDQVTVPYGHYERIKVIDENVVFASDSYNGNLRRSTDNGETWESVLNMNGIRSIMHHGYDMFVSGVNGVIMRSDIGILGVEDNIPVSGESFVLYPNPAFSMLHIGSSTDSNFKDIKVYDMCGRLLISTDGQWQEFTLDVSSLSAGHYTLKSETQDGRTFSKKFIIRDH